MKASHLTILVLILVAIGIYWFTSNSNTKEQPVPQVESQAVTNDSDTVKTPEHTMTSDKAMDMGTDVGMEMPIPDTAHPSDTPVPANAKIFNLTGKNFEFNIKEIRVRKGDTVVVNFKSADGFHDWIVDAFNARTSRIKTGEGTQVTFVADTAGTYEYYCSVASHRMNGMIGKLIVE